ncbi:hypothetical protein ASZ78_005179 [Callipepla squamata]|uniref:Coiled-coil domain-containing protein 172 n=1 Tax=Callipepla squamata TaxID=9009 RepID=A0A226N800_CALSU|nr:hypothetical protein ASZ78_005179 [Callipepla squamata]
MNLDTLFQQIQFTEKQVGEKRRLIQQVKFDINKCHEKTNQLKEELNTAKMKLETKHCRAKHICSVRTMKLDFCPSDVDCFDMRQPVCCDVYATVFSIGNRRAITLFHNFLFWKAQQLSEKMFFLEILKKHEDSLEKQKAELTNEKSILLKNLTDAKRKMTEEEDNFTREVTEFNNEYGLTSNRELLIKKKVKTEINDFENEAALLKNEMDTMEHKNVQFNTLQMRKNELKQELFTLEIELKDLEKLIKEAEGTTKDLEAEKVQVTEKPQTNPECLR